MTNGKRGDPGIEPGTSCTLNKNHTTRPIARLRNFPIIHYINDLDYMLSLKFKNSFRFFTILLLYEFYLF